MSEINSLIANYLQANPTADVSDIIDKMKNIQDSLWENGCITSNSIFNYGDDGVASKEEFLEIMSNATGKDSSEIEDDVNLLFDILNSESDDDVLTSDELGFFGSSSDSWNQLSTVDKNAINEASAASSSSDDAGIETTGTSEDSDNSSTSSLSESEIADIAQSIVDGTASIDDYYGTVSSDDYTAIQAKVEELQSSDEDTDVNEDTDVDDDTDVNDDTDVDDDTEDEDTTTTTDTTTVDSVKTQIESIVLASDSDSYTCPEDVIAELEASGNYDADFIAELRNSYITYSDEDEEKISTKLQVLQMIDSGATREDAIAALQENSEIGDPVTDSTTELSSAPTGNLTETAVKYDAEKLHDAMKGDKTDFLFGLGTNEEAMDELFNDESLTSSDWVSIMSQYSATYGSALVSDIDWDYVDASEKQTEYYEKIVDNLLSEIDAGNEEALTVLCQQIHGATAGQIGTANEFMEILFENISDEDLYKVYSAYSNATGGSDLIEDIEKDYQNGYIFGFIAGTDKTGSGYITKIDEAINKYGREEE